MVARLGQQRELVTNALSKGYRTAHTGPQPLVMIVELSRLQSTPCVTHKMCRTQPSAPAVGASKTLPCHEPAEPAFLETPLAKLLRIPFPRTRLNRETEMP